MTSRTTILLVDDFEDGLDLYREYLTYRGYDVVTARNGEEAIQQARMHPVDAILMDLQMPVMTGTDAVRVLRQDPAFQRVPIIALTAHALDGEREAALAAGFDELIPKPCLPDELVRALEHILSARPIPVRDTAPALPMKNTPAKHHTGHDHIHAVRFYVDDLSLCRMVAGFIGDGLAAGQTGVVIATAAHRECILEELQFLPFDIEPLVSSGELQLLDTEETLSAFMKNGHPDPFAFATVVGAILQRARAARPHATVRAYGEMVDWLWKHDATDAAIRLEVLWNDLASRYPFSLLCGYSMGNFYKQGAYEEICSQHTHVVSDAGQQTRVRID